MNRVAGPGAAVVLAFTACLFAQKSEDIGHVIASDLKTGRYTEAKALLDDALKKSPRDARLWTLNGLALVQLGNSNEALASFNRALEISPTYIPALESAAELEFQAGNSRAAELARRIVKIRPDDRGSHAMLAAIAFKEGNCETAEQEFAKSDVEGGSDARALEEFGACLVKQKRTAEAIPVFRKASELQPGDAAAVYSLAVVQFLAHEYTDVIATLSPLAANAQADANALELLGEAYELSGDAVRATEFLQKAVAANPAEPRLYVDFANLCLAHGMAPAGIEVLNAGLQRLPGTASLYLARGLLFSELAQYEKGEADFNAAERLDPNVELGSAIRGLAELQQNNLVDAERLVRERLRLHTADAFLHYLLAEILVKKGAAPGSADFAEALNSAERAVEIQPNLTLARDVLARLYFEEGKTRESIEQSRLALRSNPRDTTALYRLILALRKSGNTEEVPGLLKQLVALRGQAQREAETERNYAAAEQAPLPQGAARSN